MMNPKMIVALLLCGLAAVGLSGEARAGPMEWVPWHRSDWTMYPASATTRSVIRFFSPRLGHFGNSCYASMEMGIPSITVDHVRKTVELWFEPFPRDWGCFDYYDPVYGLEGEFGPLPAGDWVFFNDTRFSIPFVVTQAVRPATVTVTPENPTTETPVTITVGACLPDSCFGTVGQTQSRAGSRISLEVSVDRDPDLTCANVFTWQEWTFDLGELPEGSYEVDASARKVSGSLWRNTAAAVFEVVSGEGRELCWAADTQLTYDDLSDSAPSAASCAGKVHFVWNHSYEGEVRHGVLSDITGWQDLGPVADCPTGSDPCVVEYRGALYAFYVRGWSPYYYIFGRVICESPSVAGVGDNEFPLTRGFALDRYGAAAVVYNGILHVFWKSLFLSQRYISSKTFDGNTWSDRKTVTIDGPWDGSPAVAVFDDQLFLFYGGGGRYRTFDGTSWSEENSWMPSTDGNTTPAACVFDGALHVFFLHHGKIFYKSFDGSTWSSICSVPSSPKDEPRDLACAANNGKLYLFWGSHYSSPRSELFCTTATVLEGDVNRDGTVNILDIIMVRNRLLQDPLSQGNLQADVNRDDNINILDMIFVMSRFNTRCPE